MENRELTKTAEIKGKINTYKCFYEDYQVLKKHNYIFDNNFIYLVASVYFKDGQLLRNYSYINVHKNLNDFMSVDLSIVDNMKVYFIHLRDYSTLSLLDIVEDIKSNHTTHNFCIDKLPQSL